MPNNSRTRMIAGNWKMNKTYSEGVELAQDLSNELKEAKVAGVDVVVTDTWVSMGKEEEKAARVASLSPYKVDADMMALAKPDAIFLHCLPADRGYEVTGEVIDGPQSVIWDEAENRLHAQKALLEFLVLGKIKG